MQPSEPSRNNNASIRWYVRSRALSLGLFSCSYSTTFAHHAETFAVKNFVIQSNSSSPDRAIFELWFRENTETNLLRDELSALAFIDAPNNRPKVWWKIAGKPRPNPLRLYANLENGEALFTALDRLLRQNRFSLRGSAFLAEHIQTREMSNEQYIARPLTTRWQMWGNALYNRAHCIARASSDLEEALFTEAFLARMLRIE